jgi:hypothetical protein
MSPADIQVDDAILITGTSSSPHGRRWDRVKAVVATVSDGCVKVWVDADSGKVWFPLDQIEAIEFERSTG